MVEEERVRWIAVVVLVSSSALNYLDRIVLSALAPTLKAEFHLSDEGLGWLFSAFLCIYGVSSPLVGLWIDRVGLRAGVAAIVGLWSLAGIATGFVGTFVGLLLCRGLLGFAESGGVPATGKGFALYLHPENRAYGAALNQVGITVGSMGAPLLAEYLAANYGWRSAFLVTGALGFVWIPLWLAVSRRAVPLVQAGFQVRDSVRGMLTDKRFLSLIAANGLAMGVYSLWTMWTPVFLVSEFGLTQAQANYGYVWIPPIFAAAGAFLGGWLAHRLIRSGAEVLQSRMRIAFAASFLATATALAPMAGNPKLAIAAISLSLAATTCLSVNYYALPLDLFGAARAAFAVSALTGVFGLMQAFLSPLIGRWSGTVGWQPVCMVVAVMPLCSTLLLRKTLLSK